nr:mucin-5AC isoform X4 [Drosophila suzukii]
MHQNKAFLNGNGNCNCHCCGSAAPRPAPPALFDLSLPIVTVTTTRNTCNMEYLSGRLSILWLLGLSLLLFKTGSTEAQSKRASRVTSSRSFGTNVKPTSSNGISFDCPEEFGYYPHPSDCTQYYVCVFGGALLESCTGGLMYSHELQTCDWPRNVGCELVDTSSERGPARSQGQSQTHTQAQHVPSRVRFGAAFSSPGGTQKAPTVAPQYHRSPPQVIQAQVQHIPPPPPELRVPPNPVITSRGQPKPLIESQEDIAKLYAEAQETLPPVEEEESDRQQRVYRGQPSTVSQVQRDRDGIIHQASINAIPQSGKIASYAFGTAYSESLDDDKNELSHNRLDGGRRRKRRDLTVQLTEIALTKPAGIGNFNDSNSSSEVMDPDTTSALPDSSEISNSSNNSKERFEEAAPAVKLRKYSSKISQPKGETAMEFDYEQIANEDGELLDEGEGEDDVATGESKRRPRQLRPISHTSSKWPGQNYRAIDAPPPPQYSQQTGYSFGTYNPYLTPPNPANTQPLYGNHNYNQLTPGYQSYLHQQQQVAPAGPHPQQKPKVVYTGYNLSLPPPPLEDDFRPISGSYYGAAGTGPSSPRPHNIQQQHSNAGDLLPYLIQQLKELKERRKNLQAENFAYFHLDNQPVSPASVSGATSVPTASTAHYSSVDPSRPAQQVTPNGQYSTMGGFYNNQKPDQAPYTVNYPGKLVSHYSIGSDDGQRSTTESNYFQYNIVANQKMKGVLSTAKPSQLGLAAFKVRPPVTPLQVTQSINVVSPPNLAYNRPNSLQQVPFRDFSHLPVGISYATNSTMPESYQTFTKSISTTEAPQGDLPNSKSKLTNFQFNIHEFMANLKASDLSSVNPAVNPLIKYFKQVSSDGNRNSTLRNTLVPRRPVPGSTSSASTTTSTTQTPTTPSSLASKTRFRAKSTVPTPTTPTTTRALKGYENFIKGIQNQLNKQTSSQIPASSTSPSTLRVPTTTTLETVDYYDEDYEEDEDILPPSQMPPYMPMSETMAPPRPQLPTAAPFTESPGKARPNFQTGFLEATTTRRPFPNFSQLNQPGAEAGVPSFISFPSDIFQELKQRLPHLPETSTPQISTKVTTTPRSMRPSSNPRPIPSSTAPTTTRVRYTVRPHKRGQQKWMTMSPVQGQKDVKNLTENEPEILGSSKQSNLGGLQLNSIHVGSGEERHRDIEYQQQQQQDQQQPSVPQYQPTVRQQQPHSTYRPLELSATPTPPQKSSYSNQQTLAYSSDYDEDINAQIEQENLYDQPTRSPQSSKAHAIKPYKQHVPNKSKTTTQASSTPPTTTPSSIPPPNPTTYSSNPFLKSKLQNLAKSLVHFVSNSQTKGNNTGFRQVKNLTSFDHQPTIPEPVPDQVPAQTFSPVPEPSSTQWPLVEDHVETVFDESQNVHVQTAEPPRSRSFETSTSAKFLDFINAAAYGTSPRGNLLNAVPNKFVGRDFPYRERDYSFESSSKEPELQRKRIQTYITSDVAPESFKVPANGEVRPQPEGMESASTTRPSKPIKHSLQSGSHGFSLRVEQNESESNVSEPIFAEKKSQPSTTTAKSPTTPVDSSQEYVDIIPTTYAPPLRIWRNGRPTIQQAYYRPTTTSSSTTTTSTTTSTSPPTTSNDNVHSSSTIRTTTTPRALGPPSTERYVVPGQTYTARANYFKDTLNRVTANPATRFVSPYKSLENLLQEDRQYQYHQLRTTARPRYTNAPAFPPFLHTTSKPAKNLFMTTAIRNTSQDVLATMATGNARNFSVSDAILSTFSPQRPAPSMLRTTTMATTTSTSTEPLPPEMTTTAAPTTVSAVIASSPIRVSQSPMRPRGRSRYTAATLNNVGDSVDEPTTYAPKFRLPAGFETSQFPKRKPQRVRVISNQRTSFGEPTAKPHEKYEAYKAALQAKDSAYSSHSALSKSLKHKSIENEASVADEPRAEALISQPLEARQQNSLEQGGTAIAFSSTEHVVAITDRPTVKFLYSNKYRQQTAERTLAESLQNAGYIASANGPAQKFRSANVLDQLRQFLAGSDSTSNSDESGTSQFVDEYSLPEIKAAVDEIKQLYMVTDRPATSTLQTSTTTLRPTTTPIIPPSALRSTTATVTSSVRQEANQSKAYSFPSTLKVLSTDSALTARATQSTPDVSTTRTPKDPPVYPTPAPNISTATATPSPFAPHTARASRVNNVIKSSIAAAALGPSTSTYQPPVSAGKAQKLQFGFAPNNKNHQISSNHKGAAASASVKCSDSTLNAKCNEIPLRNNNRNRGNAMYANQDRDVLSTPNRGTHPPRTRPTLKPSGTIVSKAQEFVDIYRYPPTRPDPIYPQPTPDKTAAKCRKDVCLLPDCYCGGKDIPGGLSASETPQIVLMTFDDAVSTINIDLYEELFSNESRKNPNGCPLRGTFYLSHEWTDYGMVQDLYSQGHEMASHTVSHSFGEQFSQKKWTREIAGQREILAAYGGVKLSDVRGMRAPFLSVGGNKMYKMLYDSNFTYDSSMPVYENRPPSWPYTLDYKIFHDCMIPPCPTRSYPGVWQVPMVMWQDLNGGRCSMGDACSNPSDADGVTKMIMKNFERHYTTNRAPFGLFYHAAWFTQPHHKEGFIKFLDAINAMQDVWIITNWQALQWVRDPTPTSRINSFQPFQCDYSDRPKRCNNPKVCNLWHKSGVRYMKTCQPCPDIYPWTGKSGIRSSRIDNEVEEPAA